MKQLFHNLTSKFWFLPTVLVAAGGLLAILLVQLDQVFTSFINQNIPWLFTGTPDAARTILNTIAAATITVVSISFSVTVIAMQQTATQYSTRVLRTFTSNVTNQLVLGAYLGTFLYSLLVLRAIKSDAPQAESFIPTLAVSLAIVLAVVASGLLIIFINNIARSIQVTSILNQIKNDLDNRIEEQYPEPIKQAKRDPRSSDTEAKRLDLSSATHHIRSDTAGFLININRDNLSNACRSAEWVYIRPKPGDFVSNGDVIASLKGKQADKHRLQENLGNIFDISHRRSDGQEVLYGIRQLIDLILKSLSPGINDQTSARYGIMYLGNALLELSRRAFPSPKATGENGLTVVLNQPTWEHYVNYACDEIRYESSKHILVARLLADTLANLCERSPLHRRPAVIKQLEYFEENIKTNNTFIQHDRDRLLKTIRSAYESGQQLQR